MLLGSLEDENSLDLKGITFGETGFYLFRID
jgi:hypothetical protein